MGGQRGGLQAQLPVDLTETVGRAHASELRPTCCGSPGTRAPYTVSSERGLRLLEGSQGPVP